MTTPLPHPLRLTPLPPCGRHGTPCRFVTADPVSLPRAFLLRGSEHATSNIPFSLISSLRERYWELSCFIDGGTRDPETLMGLFLNAGRQIQSRTFFSWGRRTSPGPFQWQHRVNTSSPGYYLLCCLFQVSEPHIYPAYNMWTHPGAFPAR